MKLQNIHLKVVGVTFDNENGINRQEIIRNMRNDSPIVLQREPFNSHDRNAVTVFYVDQQVGYIGREYAKVLAPMMDSGRQFDATVYDTGINEGIYYLHIIVNERGE